MFCCNLVLCMISRLFCFLLYVEDFDEFSLGKIELKVVLAYFGMQCSMVHVIRGAQMVFALTKQWITISKLYTAMLRPVQTLSMCS